LSPVTAQCQEAQDKNICLNDPLQNTLGRKAFSTQTPEGCHQVDAHLESWSSRNPDPGFEASHN
jgi:hypothetical protein